MGGMGSCADVNAELCLINWLWSQLLGVRGEEREQRVGGEKEIQVLISSMKP